jgi:hypothetical protein
MPVKKTTTKAPVAKPTAKAAVTAKKTTTTVKKVPVTPTVIVKENAVKKEVCNTNTDSCGKKARATLAIALLLINTVLLAIVAFKSTSQKSLFRAMDEFEAMRVGGEANHQIMTEIYGLDAYKNDQKMRLETTLNALKQMDLQAEPTTTAVTE